MLNKFILLLVVLTFTSCATLTNTKNDKMFVYADRDSTFICVNYDTSQIYQLPAKIVLPRSEKDITLIAINDTVQRKVYLTSGYSGKTIFGNLMTGLWPFFIILDASNPKAYAYPKYTTILFDDTPYPFIGTKNWINPEKNLVRFKLGFPAGNIQSRTIAGEKLKLLSYHSASMGVEYYFSNKFSIDFSSTLFKDHRATYFTGDDGFRHPTYHVTTTTNLQIGTDIKRFHVASGFSYSKLLVYYQTKRTFFDPYNNPNELYDPIYRIKYFGPSISTYFRLSSEFNIAANYYASLISKTNGSKQSEYGHILSLEILYTPDIFRPSKVKSKKNGNKPN